MTDQPYPKWIPAPAGYSPANKPFREFHIGHDSKMTIVVQNEEDEAEVLGNNQREFLR